MEATFLRMIMLRIENHVNSICFHCFVTTGLPDNEEADREKPVHASPKDQIRDRGGGLHDSKTSDPVKSDETASA